MSRYKFRAWDKANKEMRDIVNLDWEDGWDDMSIKVDMYNDYFNEEEMIPMQCTGLKDRGGAEIYEGDILWDDVEEEYGYIYWEPRGAAFEIAFQGVCYELLDFDTISCDIVGNIYENPELVGIKENEDERN